MSDGRPGSGGSPDEARDRPIDKVLPGHFPVVVPGGAGIDFSRAPASPASPPSGEPAETVPRGTDEVPGSTMPEGRR